MFSLVIPIYKNEANLDRLLAALAEMHNRLEGRLEIVFVVDGSPDRCYQILRERLPASGFSSQLLSLSRNFGSFAAITAGLGAARGEYLAVLAADLQEPPELIDEFFRILSEDRADVVFGTRANRSDPLVTDLSSKLFWGIYRRFVLKEIPRGGVDVFGCNRVIRDRLLSFRESNTNVVALLFWLGYRRAYVPYERRERLEGRSAWTVRKRLQYAMDSIFNFTDLPIQILLYAGSFALLISVTWALTVLILRFAGKIEVRGYTAILIAILFFGALTSLGLGVIGQYLWLTLQNTRGRPNFVIAQAESFEPVLHANAKVSKSQSH